MSWLNLVNPQDDKLPVQYSLGPALKIYARRLAVVFIITIANLMFLGLVMLIIAAVNLVQETGIMSVEPITAQFLTAIAFAVMCGIFSILTFEMEKLIKPTMGASIRRHPRRRLFWIVITAMICGLVGYALGVLFFSPR